MWGSRVIFLGGGVFEIEAVLWELRVALRGSEVISSVEEVCEVREFSSGLRVVLNGGFLNVEVMVGGWGLRARRKGGSR